MSRRPYMAPRGRSGAHLMDSLRQDSSFKPMDPVMTAYWWLRDKILGLACLVKGCNFDTYTFHSNRLYFCRRCHQEMLGRTFADLTPEPYDDSDDWGGDHAL